MRLRWVTALMVAGLSTVACSDYAPDGVELVGFGDSAIIGGSLETVRLSNAMLTHGVNVQPVMYPAVEERAARLRFFMSCDHTTDQITGTISALVSALAEESKSK